jgi:hypothetical protein
MAATVLEPPSPVLIIRPRFFLALAVGVRFLLPKRPTSLMAIALTNAGGATLASLVSAGGIGTEQVLW